MEPNGLEGALDPPRQSGRAALVRQYRKLRPRRQLLAFSDRWMVSCPAFASGGQGPVLEGRCEGLGPVRDDERYEMGDRRSSFSYEDLLACGRGEMFGPGNAQLPLPPMLMFDRIAQISEEGGAYGKGVIRAELDVRPDLWFFDCHFKGDPVMPGCLGLDAMWQLVGFYLGWLGSPGRGRALGVGEVKFVDQVLPNVKKVVYGIDLKRVFRGKLVLGIADGWLEADGKRIYEAKDLRVGLFQPEAAA